MFKSANHSAPRWKMNLQLFAGDDDDAILPDDYVDPDAAPPEAGAPPVTPVAPEGDTTPPEQQPPADPTPPPADTPKIKVKYNHEEKELGFDEAVPLIQKGMNYDKLQEKLATLENDPARQFIERLARSHDMTAEQYLIAVKEEEERQQLNELVQKNIPPELAQEVLQGRKDREERAKEKAEMAEQEKRDSELTEFIQYFQSENNRPYDPDKDAIPKEVWEANAKGTPLKFAFMDHQNRQLKSQLKIVKQNEENAQRAPVGSVTAHGSTEVASDDNFIKGFNSV